MFHDWNAFWRANVASIFTFCTIHQVLSKLISKKNERQHWKQVNIGTSFAHSVISSVLSLYCFLENPSMCTTGIISSFTPFAYSYVSFELGYFIFDAIDLLRNFNGRQTCEILLHHVTIMFCFGISLYLGQYVGYCVLSLFLEFNSVFLHLRQLLIFCGRSRDDRFFRLVKLCNIVTFVLFRFGIITYMSIWLVLNRSLVPLLLCFIGQTGLLLMTVMNCYLFSRLLKSDFASKRD